MPDGQTYDITLDTLVYGGDALGRLPDGRAVFVPYALPGECVRIQVVEEKSHHARARLVEVLTPSSERIPPRCAHYTLCGGCHYQHLPYAHQVLVKSQILKEQLERIGGLTDIPLQPAIPAPQPWNYRNHVQFHLTVDGKLGYHKARSEEAFVLQECHLPEPTLNAVWPQLDFEALPGLERIGLRQGADDDLMLALESNVSEPPEMVVEDLPISVVHLGPAGALVLAGSDHLLMEVLGRAFRVSAASFFQVNTLMAARMVEHLLAHLPLTGQSTVLDVYCGVGLFSAFLAPRVSRLIGVEASPSACTDFESNLDEFDNVELYQDTAGHVLSQLAVAAGIALVDPPRSGLDRLALQGILRLKPGFLAYISCDASTLARDARHLSAGGYHLRQITPFDLFPQTYHIESISFWQLDREHTF